MSVVKARWQRQTGESWAGLSLIPGGLGREGRAWAPSAERWELPRSATAMSALATTEGLDSIGSNCGPEDLIAACNPLRFQRLKCKADVPMAPHSESSPVLVANSWLIGTRARLGHAWIIDKLSPAGGWQSEGLITRDLVHYLEPPTPCVNRQSDRGGPEKGSAC